MIDRPTSFAGRDWWYAFRSLVKVFDEKSIGKYAQNLARSFSRLTKKWDDDLNSEWLCRVFLAAKMVLSASVMLESLEYAERKNLRVVISYLEYYAILAALRAIVFTSPKSQWKEGEIIRQSHKKTINVACDILAEIHKEFSEKFKKHILHIKAYRELISYRAPSSGDSFKKAEFQLDLIELCQVLVEIAQAQSEILETSIQKNADGNYSFLENYIFQVCHSEIDGNRFWDDEDAYRLGYLKRKYSLPTNIMHIISEGHVEDFFGSWRPKGKHPEDVFNPDDGWRVIFDVP